MKKFTIVLSVIAFTAVASGCGVHREVRTTSSSRETVVTAPVEPVLTEERTTTRTETRTTD